MSTWIIEQDDDGTCDVLKDGRYFVYDEPDLDAACDVIRRKGGDSATVVGPGGDSRTIKIKARGR